MPQVAFLDVDTQVDFIEPGGKLYAQGAEAIRPRLAQLVAHARAQGLPLVSSVDAHAPDDPELTQFPPHCLRGTPGQAKLPETQTEAMRFVPSEEPGAELPDPRVEHVVLEKQEFSLFSNPASERVLAATGARRFCVFGVVTEVCVRQAVLGLLERGYQVSIVEDAVWPIERAAGEAALAEMVAAGAERTTTAALLAGEEEVMVRDIEVLEDRTASSRCDEGFLRLRRFVLKNTYSDGSSSPPYRCDVLSRRSVDAVAVALWSRDPDTGKILVHYREGTRPPVWLRRTKQHELPYPDPAPYDIIGEIVAGVLEPEDDGPQGVARRGAIEAKEEAGYTVDPAEVHHLGSGGMFPTPGVTDEKIYLVAAEVDPSLRGKAEGDGSVLEEGTRMVTRELRDAIAACRRGEIPDAKTEMGLLRLADYLGYIPQLDTFASDLPPELRSRYDALGTRPDA